MGLNEAPEKWKEEEEGGKKEMTERGEKRRRRIHSFVEREKAIRRAAECMAIRSHAIQL